jgi:hypothetical protein
MLSSDFFSVSPGGLVVRPLWTGKIVDWGDMDLILSPVIVVETLRKIAGL